MIVESFHNGRGKLLDIEPSFKFIQGPRKSVQILFESYIFAKNNTHGNTVYWNCRSRESSIAIYSATSRGRMQLIYGGQPFIFEKTLKLSSGEEKRFWRCNQWWNQKCRSRVFTINDVVCPLNRFHTHEEIVRRKKRVRRVPPVETISKVAPTTTRQQQQQQQHQQHQHQQPQQQEIQLTSDAMLTTALEDESPATIDVSELGMHLKYEEIVADVTGIVGGATRVVSRRK
ncbi:uncharacterized protein pre-mod(mdg4)-V [Drosophila bipectinata]|uniref:uncharacterized protein pre-mod(mdg4)-V n=1 Tax=Drosophila bipectinata TaxID=42026 RepID=UPI0038B2C78E